MPTCSETWLCGRLIATFFERRLAAFFHKCDQIEKLVSHSSFAGADESQRASATEMAQRGNVDPQKLRSFRCLEHSGVVNG